MNVTEIKQYIQFGEDMESAYKQFLKEISQKNCLALSLRKSVCLNTLMEHQLREVVQILINYFKIRDKELVLEIVDVIQTVDNRHFFKQNVGLYLISINFLVHLNETLPGLITDRNSLLSFLLICLIVVHKFYVDCPYTNNDVGRWFQINVKHVNFYELYILTRLQFRLPFAFLSE